MWHHCFGNNSEIKRGQKEHVQRGLILIGIYFHNDECVLYNRSIIYIVAFGLYIITIVNLARA